jgi:hypothetical protein
MKQLEQLGSGGFNLAYYHAHVGFNHPRAKDPASGFSCLLVTIAENPGNVALAK